MEYVSAWEPLPLLLGTEEAARVLGYNQARVRELCKANILPCVRLGRAYRIPKEALRTWVLEQAKIRTRSWPGEQNFSSRE
ncbi:MAG: Helix-turn-helix domain protein [Pelotomaculum sp. PtaB.Bin104]|nr:MAG: Helix-turn-helix domain protein [Pelotomaculum sp. PtaB.Bin104]